MLHFLKNKPAFLLLLPFFFVLHGFIRNYHAVTAGDALLLFFLYAACAIFIAGISWFFYKDIIKASLFSFALIAYQLFFGNIQDTLKSLSGGSFISQYRFILPASLFLFVLSATRLRKRKNPLSKISFYFNTLFSALILIDAGLLILKINREENYITLNRTMDGHSISSSYNKPDIYFLLMDQYAGKTALHDIFHFNNSDFMDKLKSRGFHIATESKSNYNLTPFSMASILSMNYLDPETVIKKHLDVTYSYQAIRNSTVIKFLTGNGYRFYNNSVFDFPDQPAHQYNAFLPYGLKLLTLSTFTGRLSRDVHAAIIERKFGSESVRKKIAYEYLNFNDSIFTLTRNIVTQKNSLPKFVYAHFMLPHFPYYFDSKGNPLPFKKLTEFKKTNSTDYIEYLQYGNQKILQLIDHILTNSLRPPIIILLSDHGFRNPDKKEHRKYDFANLNATYLPGANYSGFYDSISNVNQFRVLFNTCFNQQLPLLKDSVIDLWD